MIIGQWSLTKACDACGCSMHGIGVDMISVLQKNYFGMQYYTGTFTSNLPDSKGSKDKFRTLDFSLWVGIKYKWYVLIDQPYIYNTRKHPDGNGTVQGIGDSKISVHYILSKQSKSASNLHFYIDGGMGIKGATGKYDPYIHIQQNLPENFNVGNGSWGIFSATNIGVSNDRWLAFMSTQYMHFFNTKEDYHFGDQSSAQLVLGNKLKKMGAFSLTPYAGFLGEFIQKDHKSLAHYSTTGGAGLYTSFGISIQSGRFNFNTYASIPLVQQYSNDDLQAANKIQFQISYLFN